MEDILSYRLSDLLLFSEQTFYRQFALYNKWLGPFQFLTYLYCAFFLFVLLERRVLMIRVFMLITAIFWLICIYGFLHQFYAQINWMTSYLIPVMSVQPVLLLWLSTKVSEVPLSYTALVLWLTGLIQPVFELAIGRSAEALSAYALTPDSLSIGCLALMIMLQQSTWLFIPAFVWLLFSALTYFAMGSPMFWYLVFALVVVVTAMVIDRLKYGPISQRKGFSARE